MSRMDLESRSNLALRASAAAMALCVLGTGLPHTLPPLAENSFYLLKPRRHLPRGFLKEEFAQKVPNSAFGITELPDYSLILSYSHQGARLVRKADRDKVDEHGEVDVDDDKCTTPFEGHSWETLYLPDVKVLINCSTNLAAYKVDFSEEEDGCSSGPPPRFSRLWSLPAHQPLSLCRLGGTLSSSPFVAVSSFSQKRLDVFKLDLQSPSTPPKEYFLEFGGYMRVSAIPGAESSLLYTSSACSVRRMDIHINKDTGEISGCTIHPSVLASGGFYGICCVDKEWALACYGGKLKRFRHWRPGAGVTTEDTNEMSDVVHKKEKVAPPPSSSLSEEAEAQQGDDEPTIIRSRVVFVSDVSGDTMIGVDGQFFVYE